MGNSASSTGRGNHDDTVDYGYLTPQGIYTGARDWNQAIVAQLICDRKLAPFYRPLEDYDESWDEEQILAARKEPLDAEGAALDSASLRTHESVGSNSLKASHSHNKRQSPKEPVRCPEAAVYRGAVECPICFLYYPPNINHSRCCDQAICTECFVQIKRADPTPQHLVSEPAACPYCVQENFGIVYTPPVWRAGIGSEGALNVFPDVWSGKSSDSPPPVLAHKRRTKSFGADSPEVVTTDQIRPDWEAKLAAVRAAVARRANRRIIMRQVGDRLIPVGVTSGRVHALAPEEASAHVESGDGSGSLSRRTRRRNHGNQDVNQLLGTIGLGGQDLEELMVMEAMRLSLLEHEAQQKREREERGREASKNAGENDQSGHNAEGTSSQSISAGGSLSLQTESSNSSATVLPSSTRSIAELALLQPPNSVASASPVSLTRPRSITPRNSSLPVLPPMETSDTLTQSFAAELQGSSTHDLFGQTVTDSLVHSDLNVALGPLDALGLNTALQPRIDNETVDSPTDASGDISPSEVTAEPRSAGRPNFPLHADSFASSFDQDNGASDSYHMLPSSSESSFDREPLIDPPPTSQPHTVSGS